MSHESKYKLKSVKFNMRDGASIISKMLEPNSIASEVCVFLHGASLHSDYYLPFGESLRKQGILTYLIDIRGHGDSIGQKQKLKYIGQLEDDLQDIIVEIQMKHPKIALFLLGYSFGAAIILRHIKKYPNTKITGTILISPAIFATELVCYHDFTQRWIYALTYLRKLKYFRSPPPIIKKYAPKFHGIQILLAHFFPFMRRFLKGISFVGDKIAAKKDKRVLNYDYNLLASYNVSTIYNSIFKIIRRPTLIIIGSKDEFISPLALETIITWNTLPSSSIEYCKMDGANHNNICMLTTPIVINWFSKVLNKQ
jgi:pimeloyl-ACP methyl ester carboxylesterase